MIVLTYNEEVNIKAGLLRQAKLLILNSLSEGLPITVMEAMACGIPVVLSPFCNLPGVEERGAGVIIPLEIPRIARAIGELLRDEPRRTRMGLNAR